MVLKSCESSWLTFLHFSQGNTGVLDTASKGALEGEFGTSNEDEVIKQILEKGNIVESGVRTCTQLLQEADNGLTIRRTLAVMVSRTSLRAPWSVTKRRLLVDISSDSMEDYQLQ